MAKKLCLTDTDIRELIENACLDVKKNKYQSGEIKLSIQLAKDKRTAELLFTPFAWMKMYSLVHGFKTEVEWHGVVERVADNKFVVSDILLFPHEVTGATVTSNQQEYERWQDSLDDDTFNACRFHGHSHVNMGVTPSGTDMTYRLRKVGDFCSPGESDDFFYIFLITNKKGDISAEIYDIKNNALYGTDEIDIDLTEPDDSYKRVIAEAIDEVAQAATDYPDVDILSEIDENGHLVLKLVTDIQIGDDLLLADFVKAAHGMIKEPVRMPVTTGGYGHNNRSICNPYRNDVPPAPSSLDSRKGGQRTIFDDDSTDGNDDDWYRRLYDRGNYDY